MTSALDASIEYSRSVLGDLMVEVGVELDRVLRQRDADVDLTIGDLFSRAAKSQERVRKGLASLSNGLNDRIDDHIRAARRELSSMDAALPVLYDEIASYNALGEHERLALESIILPAIQQQEREARAELDAAEPVPPVAQVVEQIAVTPSPPPPPPPPPANGTVPPPTSGSSPPVVMPWGADIDTIPGAPAPPVPMPPPITSPPPTAPPTAPPPSAGGQECCPPAEINVILDGSFIDRIKGESPPPAPPTSPPPTGEPPSGEPPPPPSPPTTVPPTPPAAPPHSLGVMDWPNGCAYLEAITTSGHEFGAALKEGNFAHLFQLPGVALALVPGMKDAGVALARAGESLWSSMYGGAQGMAALFGVNNPEAATSLMSPLWVGGLLEKWTGFPTAVYTRPLQYMLDYSNPSLQPEQDRVDAMYLRGLWGRDTWECYTRMNGRLPAVHFETLRAQASIPSLNDAIQMRRRGYISDGQYLEYARLNGYAAQSDAVRLYNLSEYVPSTSELFRWLQKDVYNDEFAKNYGLDEDFPNPMPEQWSRWFAANGTSAEQVRYEYRAGWELPSKTQTDEFIRRLRPGRVDPALAFTVDDANQLYKLNEIPAGIRSRMLATSYQPVALSYLIEAYKAGTMDAPELTERCQDIGYSLADAQFLTRMIVAKAEGQFQGSLGAWTRRTIIQEYIGGAIDTDTAYRLLSRTVIDRVRQQEAIADADSRRDALAKRKCIKGIQRRYFTGEIDKVDARRALLALGVEMIQASGLLTGWECERMSRSKEPTVKMLTEWTQKGIITPQEMHRRLVNLGFTSDDANRIVSNADENFRQQNAKKADAAARRAAADARRAAADAKRAAKNGKK